LFGTLSTILKWAILLPVFAAIVLLAIANDQNVTVNLNPFDKSDPLLRVVLPLYQLGFLIFVVGVLLGGLIAWGGQLRRRRRLREEQSALWQTRADLSEQRRGVRPAETSLVLPRPRAESG
jgi:hypothetical protein